MLPIAFLDVPRPLSSVTDHARINRPHLSSFMLNHILRATSIWLYCEVIKFISPSCFLLVHCPSSTIYQPRHANLLSCLTCESQLFRPFLDPVICIGTAFLPSLRLQCGLIIFFDNFLHLFNLEPAPCQRTIGPTFPYSLSRTRSRFPFPLAFGKRI